MSMPQSWTGDGGGRMTGEPTKGFEGRVTVHALEAAAKALWDLGERRHVQAGRDGHEAYRGHVARPWSEADEYDRAELLENASVALLAATASQIKGVHGAADAMGQLNDIVGVGDMRMEQLAGRTGA